MIVAAPLVPLVRAHELTMDSPCSTTAGAFPSPAMPPTAPTSRLHRSCAPSTTTRPSSRTRPSMLASSPAAWTTCWRRTLHTSSSAIRSSSSTRTSHPWTSPRPTTLRTCSRQTGSTCASSRPRLAPVTTCPAGASSFAAWRSR